MESENKMRYWLRYDGWVIFSDDLNVNHYITKFDNLYEIDEENENIVYGALSKHMKMSKNAEYALSFVSKLNKSK